MPLSSFGRLTLLGKGSYGKVYRAVRADDSVEYAIKELNIAHMNKREREESANEVRLLASISHPNIIRYYEAFVELDHLYIVTELAATDLNTLIEQKKRTGARLSEDTIWSYFIQMCIGLKYLHDANVMHRDLKPQNVFITKSHAIKIGDLGCSKLMKSAHAQTQCGTPYYMSPELWKNQGYGKPSDVWALGCVLYHMATLTTPFDAADLKGLARKVVNTKSPKIRSAYRYSADLTTLAAKLLAKEPNQRPSVGAILASQAVQKRMGLVEQLLAPAQPHARGNGEGAAEAMGDGKSQPPATAFSLHKTIVVPSNIGNLKYQLPASRYNTPPATAGSAAAAAVNNSVSARSASDPMRRLQAAQQSSQAAGGAGHHYAQPHAPVPVASSAPATPAPAGGALQRVNPNVPPSSRRGQQAMSQDNPMINKPYPALKPSHAQQQQQQQQQYYDGDKENAGGGGGGFLPKVRASAQQMAAAAAAAQLGQNVRPAYAPARQWDVSDAGDRLAELPQFASRAGGGGGGQPQTGSASVLNAQSRYGGGNGYGAAVGGALKHHQHQQQQALQSQYQQSSQQSQGSSYAQHPYTGAYAPSHAHGQSSLAPLLGGGVGAGPTPKSTYAMQHSPASALAQRQRAAAHGLSDASSDPYSGRGVEYGRKPGALPALGTRPW